MIIYSSETSAQRARLLDQLHQTPVTTFDARVNLDIPHPAARVKELREAGHRIVTHRRTLYTGKGRHNRVAEYVLLSGGV